MSIKINFQAPALANFFGITTKDPITGEVDEHRPILRLPVQWTNGNVSSVYIWQVSPAGWNYYDDCDNNGRFIQNRDLTYLLWNYGLSDSNPELEDIIRSNVEWI